VDVVCPGFAVDCLETLEEIALENKSIFLKSGGTSYRYIPALNDSVAHVKAIVNLLEQKF
ncbi:MAG: ferrochelatase, partial [Methylococcaceae bacterium]|nr:ferrochelatase [Methylococcaceae bacterium]